MRKTNIALLVAAVAISPLALADGGYHHSPSDGTDITVTDSFNHKIDKDVAVTYDKDVTVTDSFNDDNDTLSLENVNNTKTFDYTDNTQDNDTETWSINFQLNEYEASAELDGMVTDNDVSYGGGECCRGGWGHHDYGYPSQPSTLSVKHTNSMDNIFVGAAGINIAGQNAGNNSLVQQSASTNASLSK